MANRQRHQNKDNRQEVCKTEFNTSCIVSPTAESQELKDGRGPQTILERSGNSSDGAGARTCPLESLPLVVL